MEAIYKLPLILEPQPEGGYTVTCPVVPEMVTEGETLAEAMTNASADIFGVGVCNLLSCNSHASAYRLYVDVNDPISVVYNLRQVVFAATTVPSGTDFNGSCTLGTSHSPTASTFSGTDSGGFECTFDCNQSGTTVSLTYN